MGRCIKNITISVLAAIFSLFALSGPVFAVTPDLSSSPITTFSTVTPNPTTPEDPENPENPTTPENPEEQTGENPTCYDQVGGVGWLVCPGTGFLANIIDGAYDILENLIKVNPIPADESSPIHVVWAYLRNLTNVVFIIFLLIVIYSQLTGFGINNYGIKRVLPRIIIAAILVNLSYIVCIFAVDISNILGSGFRGALDAIQQAALTNGTVSDVAANTSVAGIVATILGIGTVGTVATLTFAGGFTGLLWLLIPIVLSGAIAVLSAVVTMAARQALIFLLVMISPLAFVAYLLPNTEKWFKRWYNLFMSMLIFYPMFSLLYGASRLAGLVVITSATNWLGVVLGIAIEVLPLFMSIPLMRMSGTMLGRIDGLIHRAGAPIHGMAIRRSTEGQILAKQRQLASTSHRPSTRLAQYLEQRRLNRKLDTDDAIATGHKMRMANYNRSMYDSYGRLTNRGLRRYTNIQRGIDYDNVVTKTAIDFDEGFADNGTDPRVRARDLQRIRTVNTALISGVDTAQILKSRQRSVELENTRSRAERIRAEAENEHSEIHRQITSTFNMRNSSTDPAEQRAIQSSINATLSDAISDSRKVDSIARSNFRELYDDMPAGHGPQDKLVEAFSQQDYNSMAAAVEVMAKRGDFKDIQETLFDNSASIVDNVRMQKQLADSLIVQKADDQILWAYAKANMVRRGMNSGGKQIAPFIDFKTFINGGTMPGDVDADAIKTTSLDKILEDVKGSGTTATQDRTVFKAMLSFMKKGELSVGTADNPNLHIPMKYLRSAAVSGAMDGEQLGTLNKYLTFGFDATPNATQDPFFEANKAIVEQNINNFFKDMAASQLVSIKSSTFKSMNSAMLTIDPSSEVEINGYKVSQKIIDALQARGTIDAVNRPNYSARAGMNPEVREMLGIRTDI